MNNSNDFLQEYLDSLLNDTALGAVPTEQARIDDALKLAAGSNIAPLPSTPRAARVVPARPYAEPIRTLNLRMPLPPVAEAAVIDAKQAVKTKPLVEAKPILESKTALDVEAVAVMAKAAIETTPVVEATSSVKTESLLETEIVEAKSIVEISPAVEAEAVAEIPVEHASPVQAGADLSAMAPPAAWLSNGRPQWAQQPFECLIFKAGGLQLAAPLVELGSIYPLEEGALTEIFGQTQWFMGLLPIKEYNVRAMDTGLVVMPERYTPAMREHYRYVVSLFGSDWGLAVDAVVGTTLLDPERVRWRGERSKRPWLAGTLIDQMCALFDISQLAWLFHNQDRKRTKR